MHVVHSLPGRVRVELPEILSDPVLSKLLARDLHLVKGIIEVSTNRWSGRILIQYDPGQLSLSKLMPIIDLHSENIQGASTVFDDIDTQSGLNSKNLMFKLRTDADKGLDRLEAKVRLERYGANLLPSLSQPSVLDIFVRTLTESYMSKVLLALGAFSLLIGKTANACMSMGVLLANTTMAVVQERRTQTSLRLLGDLVPPQATVLRDGRPYQIGVAALVAGDIILLEAGEKVPADACLLSSSELVVEEASLTGESFPVVKVANSRRRDNTVYMGTGVLSGSGKAVVIGTGINTAIGRISRTLVKGSSTTPLQQRLDEVFVTLVNGGLALSGIAVLAGIRHAKSLGDIVENATGLAVSFIPDGLAPIITLTTALGAMRLLQKHVAMRYLTAIDTIGCTTVICFDKTGTLTCNKMEVQEVFSSDQHWRLEGQMFVPIGKTKASKLINSYLLQVFGIACLCNNAILKQSGNGEFTAEGESTECALLLGGLKAGLSLSDVKSKFERIGEIPFSSESRFMAVIVKADQGQSLSLVKGAPDIIIERCVAIEQDGRILPITTEDKTKLLAKVDDLSGRALRVLAMAYKSLENGPGSPDQELIFSGLIGIIDPPRPEAKLLLDRCRRAGVKAVMITGDHKATAVAVARRIGLLGEDQSCVVTGRDLENMTEQEMSKVINQVQVYARTSPQQKQKLVRALKQQGEIVTMVGDGVNDVPAIREAHVGIAMAASGTAIARETSTVALTDDNIGGLLEAIREGRNVYANIRRTVRYMITTNFGDGIVLLLASVFGGPLPFTPLQLLWVNFTSDPYVSWSLANFPPEARVMHDLPRQSHASIFDQGLGRKILSRSLCLGLSAFKVYKGSLSLGEPINVVRTKTMATLTLGRLLHVTDFRQKQKETSAADKALDKGSIIMLSALLGATYIPGLASSLQTVALAKKDWLPVLTWASLGYITDTAFNRLQGLVRKCSKAL